MLAVPCARFLPSMKPRPCAETAVLQERTILQFGKVGADAFTMDYAYPMTALQVRGLLGAS